MKRLFIILIIVTMIYAMAAPVYAADTTPTTDNNGQSVVDLRDQSDATTPKGLKSIIREIFGEYTPVITSTVIDDPATNTQYIVDSVAEGAAGIDFEYIAGVLLFAIILWSLFRLVGGIIK